MDADARLAWFREARFGVFVHWGMYSVLGRGEQILSRDVMPLDEYVPYAAQFKPDAGWADRLAEQAAAAGAKYVVLTTRHHDGYCLFETATHDFNAAGTGPGRDLIAEYVAALRRHGLRVGLYYSLMTWRWRGFWDAAGYPEELPRIVDEVHAQVRELLTHYGQVDILWYDGTSQPGQRTPGTWQGTPIDQTPAEFWRAVELNAMARELQPQILINNRAGTPEDFGTPEQRVEVASDRAWETCMTLNPAPGWGYLRWSSVDKSPGEVLYNLIDAVRLGGNFLLNVGPDGSGAIADRESRVLAALGQWFEKHGEAVYGTQPEGLYPLQGHPQGVVFHYGMFTCRGSTAYLTLFRYPGESVVISKVAPAIKSATLLTTGQPLKLTPLSNSRTRIDGLPAEPPDPLGPVIQIEFEGPPRRVETTGARWLTGDFA